MIIPPNPRSRMDWSDDLPSHRYGVLKGRIAQCRQERDDFAPFEELVRVLSRPFDDQPEFARYLDPPEAHERVYRTFCGT